MKKQVLASLIVGTALSSGALVVHAADNPFAATPLAGGYQLAQADTGDKADKKADGSCGASKKKADGRCGADKKAAMTMGGKTMGDKKKDGKCGEAKCGADKK